MPLIVKNTQVKKLHQQSQTVKTQVKKAYVMNKGLKQLVYNSEYTIFDENNPSADYKSNWYLYAFSTGGWGSPVEREVATGSTGEAWATLGNVTIGVGVQTNRLMLYTNHSTVGGNHGHIATRNQIDVSGFTKMTITYYRTGYRHGDLPIVGLSTDLNHNQNFTKSANLGTSTTVEIDISGLQGSYYFKAYWNAQAYGSGPRDEGFYITKIVLS